MQDRLKFASLVAALLVALPETGHAGPNAGGTLILHYRPIALRYWIPCGLSQITRCEDAVTSGTESDGCAVYFALAAFPTGSSPRLTETSFGITYTSGVFLGCGHEGASWARCGDVAALTDSWPASGSGAVITWNTAQTGTLTEVAAFAGYYYSGYSSGDSFCLTPHPVLGGTFRDDSNPPLVDPIADFGCLGFGSTPGYLPCPAPVGACCFPSGECALEGQELCLDDGGSFQGVGTLCEPNPCPPPLGACCLPSGQCVVASAGDCSAQGGTYVGDGTNCDADPCSPTAIRRSSWGLIKARHE